MVLINDDQSGIADIVLGVWLKVKKLNYPSAYYQAVLVFERCLFSNPSGLSSYEIGKIE